MAFKKGYIPWNKGKKLSDEYRGKLKKAKENYKPNFGGKHYNGHKFVDKNMRDKISKSLMGHEVKQSTINKIKIARAKQILPIKDTKIEIKIQNYLKQLGIEFFTHQYMKEIEHGYQCDILIPSMNLVIECDGDYWHKYPTGNEIDHVRTSELIKNGFKVLRLWECKIKTLELNDFKSKLGGINNGY